MLPVPLVLVSPSLALLVLSTQLSLEPAEALYLAAVCLKQPGMTLSHATRHVGALCEYPDRLACDKT